MSDYFQALEDHIQAKEAEVRRYIKALNAIRFCRAIEGHKTLTIEYDGLPRHVLPLIWGRLKNGKQALLCVRLNGSLGSFHGKRIDVEPEQITRGSIRCYHAHKINSIAEYAPGDWELIGRIDYYITKHFRQDEIYQSWK